MDEEVVRPPQPGTSIVRLPLPATDRRGGEGVKGSPAVKSGELKVAQMTEDERLGWHLTGYESCHLRQLGIKSNQEKKD